MSGYMIEIEREKQTEMAECAEKILKYGGKLMQCIEELGEDEQNGRIGSRMGYRQGVRGTGPYGRRMGYREEMPDYREDIKPGMMGYREPYNY